MRNICVNYFKFGPMVQEEMLYGALVWSKMICAKVMYQSIVSTASPLTGMAGIVTFHFSEP